MNVANLDISKKIKKNILLSGYTTFKIGGKTRYFLEAKNSGELVKAINWAKEKSLPFFILGGGSNTLVSDRGFGGLIINLKSKILNLKTTPKELLRNPTGQATKNSKLIYVEAGVLLKNLLELATKKSLSGLEWAAGIPKATIGGAIRGNAGAFGESIADIVEEVECLDALRGKMRKIKKSECGFGYKETIFKKNHNLIILSAVLRFKKTSPTKVKEKIDYVLNYRKEHHPKAPSVGSIFKNPQTAPAGKLIAECGLSYKKIGGAQISAKHCNFIINTDKAKASDVKKLIKLAKQKVKQKFDIMLEEEIQYLGFGKP